MADSYQLGTVIEPIPGHEHAVGCLSIPYLTPNGVVGIKFRRIDGSNPKYIWPTGQKIGMFNVVEATIADLRSALESGEVTAVDLVNL